MNEALVLSSVRQHELLETIQRGEEERRELVAQMYRAQKLESLGLLAGGIAHDLNNILTPVMGYVELASELLPKESPAAPLLEEVKKNTHRAAELIQQILAFAGKGRFVIELVNLSTLIHDMSPLLRTAASGHCELQYHLAENLPSMKADVTQLGQMMMNLVTNAAEASEDGGTITISTGLLSTSHSAPSSDAEPKRSTDTEVYLEVKDSGRGMTKEVMEKIFDPFYTTKFTGRGLGLAVVQGIVRGHHGILQVVSEPGRGSTFRIVLPSSTQAVPIPVKPQQPKAWQGTGTILVIDDEKPILDIARRILQHSGLEVLVAADGQTGLKIFRESEKDINAVVLDMTMPQMSGLEVATALRLIRLDLPIVLMSGYSTQEITLQSAGLEITGFVKKPFTMQSFTAAIRQALRQ